MGKEPIITNEGVDDIPLLLKQLVQHGGNNQSIISGDHEEAWSPSIEGSTFIHEISLDASK
ncbi:hypothetical protein NIES4101_64960 [Calothrix sp. NIES-4101]|nr:hypothetical protein NIES4101_64960 [Calothrix sp. NIES-4101]